MTRYILKLSDEEECKRENNRLTFKMQIKDEPRKSHTHQLNFDPLKEWI